MTDFNFKWYRGKQKKPRNEYFHKYYLKVLKPKRKKKEEKKMLGCIDIYRNHIRQEVKDNG